MRPGDFFGKRPMVYLATPYTHADLDERKSRYWRAVRCLGEALAGGRATVFSPIAHSHPAAVTHGGLPEDWEFWRAQCFPFLRNADMLVVVLLEGWERSKDVQAEIEEASRLTIPVEHVEPENVREFFS